VLERLNSKLHNVIGPSMRNAVPSIQIYSDIWKSLFVRGLLYDVYLTVLGCDVLFDTNKRE